MSWWIKEEDCSPLNFYIYLTFNEQGWSSFILFYTVYTTRNAYTALIYATVLRARSRISQGHELAQYSTILGQYRTILGQYSTILGQYSTILGQNSTILGQYSTILRQYSTILGQYSTILGQYSTILGQYSTILEQYSTILGQYSTILGQYKTILGQFHCKLGLISSTGPTFYSARVSCSVKYRQYKAQHNGTVR